MYIGSTRSQEPVAVNRRTRVPMSEAPIFSVKPSFAVAISEGETKVEQLENCAAATPIFFPNFSVKSASQKAILNS